MEIQKAHHSKTGLRFWSPLILFIESFYPQLRPTLSILLWKYPPTRAAQYLTWSQDQPLMSACLDKAPWELVSAQFRRVWPGRVLPGRLRGVPRRPLRQERDELCGQQRGERLLLQRRLSHQEPAVRGAVGPGGRAGRGLLLRAVQHDGHR